MVDKIPDGYLIIWAQITASASNLKTLKAEFYGLGNCILSATSFLYIWSCAFSRLDVAGLSKALVDIGISANSISSQVGSESCTEGFTSVYKCPLLRMNVQLPH